MKAKPSSIRPLSSWALQFTRGTQILYIPEHLLHELLSGNGVEVSYPSGAQPGFITSGPNNTGAYFCRYWAIRDRKPTQKLRTIGNSESTDPYWLFLYGLWDQEFIDKTLKGFC
jgi:hypothetical protein